MGRSMEVKKSNATYAAYRKAKGAKKMKIIYLAKAKEIKRKYQEAKLKADE